MNAPARLYDIPIPADDARKTAFETAVEALRYLIDEFDRFGSLDATNMRRARQAEAIGSAVLALDAALSRDA